MKYLFTTATQTTSDKVLKLFALGKGSNILKAIDEEKSRYASGEANSEGASGGITVKRIGAVKAK